MKRDRCKRIILLIVIYGCGSLGLLLTNLLHATTERMAQMNIINSRTVKVIHGPSIQTTVEGQDAVESINGTVIEKSATFPEG